MMTQLPLAVEVEFAPRKLPLAAISVGPMMAP